jgi:TP901 family phage tail tape measure protein
VHVEPQGAVLGNAVGYVDINTSGVSTNLNRAKQEFNGFIQQTGSMMQFWGSQIAGFGQNMMLWTAPVGIAVATGLNVAADFDSVLTEIQARTGLTADAMEQVRQTALQLGADTAFSSQQAADAFLNLLTAGLSVEESLATLPQVLTAAAAGGMDLATAADLTTSIMASFNLSAQDTTAIIDSMSRAAAASPATMNEIGIAMQDVGGLARMYNLSLDQTAAILAIFARNGIRGAEAGTQLRSMLRNLSDPTQVTQAAWDALGTSLYNADGSMRNLDEVLVDIRAGLVNLPVQQQNEIINQLAGSYGMAGFNALLASEGIAAMEASMAEQSAATEVARARMAAFSGVIEAFKGSIETLWITVLTPFMNNVLRPLIGGEDGKGGITGIANAFTAWAAANEPLVQNIMTLVFALLGLGPTLFAVGRGIQLFGFFLTVVANPLAWIIAAIGGLAYLFRGQLLGALQTARSAIDMFFQLIQNGVPILTALQTAIGATFGTWDWSQIGVDILNGLSAGVSSMGVWVNDTLISPLVSAFAYVDWGAVGNTILQGIGLAISLYSGWINFVTDNILNPLFTNARNALGTIDWAQLGQDIVAFIFNPSSSNAGGVDWGAAFTGWMDAIGNFASSVFDFLGWTLNNVVSPLWSGIVGGLASVDWNQVGTTLMSLFGMALNTLWAGATWAWDNLISPMINSIGTSLASVDWGQLAMSLLDALGNAFMTLVAWENWVKSNILDFILSTAQLAVESVDWFMMGAGIVNAIGAALTATFDFLTWIVNSIFNPVTANAEGAAAGVDWGAVGNSIMGAIAGFIVGFFEFGVWLADTVFRPLVAGASSAIQLTDWGSIGQGLMDAIANALPNIAQWVQDWIIGPITSALSGFNPMAGINTTTQLGGGGQANSSNIGGGGSFGGSGGLGKSFVIPKFATGINFIPSEMIAQLHPGEAVIPANMNPFNPNAQQNGLGMAGGLFEGAQFVFPNARTREEGQEVAAGFGETLEQLLRERDL